MAAPHKTCHAYPCLRCILRSSQTVSLARSAVGKPFTKRFGGHSPSLSSAPAAVLLTGVAVPGSSRRPREGVEPSWLPRRSPWPCPGCGARSRRAAHTRRAAEQGRPVLLITLQDALVPRLQIDSPHSGPPKTSRFNSGTLKSEVRTRMPSLQLFLRSVTSHTKCSSMM